MKKLILFTFFVVSTGLSFSQFISFEYTQILIYSVEINYSSSSGSYEPWSPNLGFYSNAMAQLQARYDRNFNSLSKEYLKLKDLKLINNSNQSTLNNYRDERLYYIKNSISRWDLTIDSKYLEGREYICKIYSYPSIKNEILLLQSCQKELNRIKYKDPDNFLYSTRYQSIMKTIEKLKNCSTSEIEELSWERTELENHPSYSSSIIGKPIRIGDIEVAYNHFPNELMWNDAVKACTDLGNGWRLPTKDELNFLYENKDKIGGFAKEFYWSSAELNNSNVWMQAFVHGYQTTENIYNFPHYVRAVRTFRDPINSSSIIGKQIKIGNLEVAQHDFPNYMLFYEAVKACTDLGNGWRLPTYTELNIIIQNKDKIAGFPEHGYLWYSTGDNLYCYPGYYRTFDESLAGSPKVAYVRAVRSF